MQRQRSRNRNVGGAMLDFNHRPKLFWKNKSADRQSADNRTFKQTSEIILAHRSWCFLSVLLQFEYTDTPKDEDQNFTGKTFKIFQAGHVLRLMIQWLRLVGINLLTTKTKWKPVWISLSPAKLVHIDGCYWCHQQIWILNFRCFGMQNHKW